MVTKSQKRISLLAGMLALSCEVTAAPDPVLLERLNNEFKASVLSVGPGGKSKPEVIAVDLNKSTPLSELVSTEDEQNAEEMAFEAKRNEMVNRIQRGETSPEIVKKEMFEAMFPVRTNLKPALLPSREIKLTEEAKMRFSQPMVVIGTDKLSVAWLQANLNEVRRMGASVIVTQVETPQDFTALRDMVQGVPMIPLNAEHMLKEIGLSTYPIMLTRFNAYQ
ncbi:PFL_4695 family integrating conjugative element protein [Vibrio mediterranei]|uniref:PFL_4695 family integrating conjugative element protein n=1 Tax=Vibrio mediterranei TaxID=689 RepID=UPI0040698AC6